MADTATLMKQLEHCDDATSFFNVANQLINLKLKHLLPHIFVQDALVMEHAVEPLLKKNGPLETVDVMSKLVFALGKISIETYADIGTYGQVLEYVSSQPERTTFSDDVVYDFISNQAILATPQNRVYIDSINQLKFSFFESFSKIRYESLIKTVLKLSCEMLLEKITHEINEK